MNGFVYISNYIKFSWIGNLILWNKYEFLENLMLK